MRPVVGNGQLLPGYSPAKKFMLTKWPQIEREFPKHFRLATVMMKGPALVKDIAELSGVSAAEVIDFINAGLLTGAVVAEGGALGCAATWRAPWPCWRARAPAERRARAPARLPCRAAVPDTSGLVFPPIVNDGLRSATRASPASPCPRTCGSFRNPNCRRSPRSCAPT